MQRSLFNLCRWLPVGIVASALIGAAACGGGGRNPVTPPPDGEFVGAVPKEEFDALPTPSYALLADAYGRTLRDDPTALHLDEVKFSRKLFDMVKSLTPGNGLQRAPEDSGTTLLSLSDEEWRLAIAEPVGTYQAHLTKQITEQTIDDIFGTEGRLRNDKVDAFRLSYWNALSVQRLRGILLDVDKSVETMRRITEAHVKAGQTPREIEMDLNNGLVGRKAILENIFMEAHQLKTNCSTIPAEYLAPSVPIIQLESRTVYFAGVTNIDGTWTGQLTNADSGNETPWSATLYVNHFGGKIRGELHLFRGNQFARRRFTGDTDFSTSNISFHYPYQWELGGASPCGGMTTTLQSGNNRLVGPWASSSCPQGGQITLERGVGLGASLKKPMPQVNSGCPCSS